MWLGSDLIGVVLPSETPSVNVGLRLTLGFLTISPSRMSPFNHIGTLPLQRLPNHEYSFSALFCTVVILNGTRFTWNP